MTTIEYQTGTDKKNRAAFLCGKASIPAAMISRVLKAIEGKSDAAKIRIFISKLAPKHSDFFEAMDKVEISYQDAIQKLIELSPVREKATPRITKEASAVANLLCRKYAKRTPEEMFGAFLETVSIPEFKTLVVELTTENEKKFGRNAQGKIRVRKERKDLVANAEKARAGRKKKA